MCNVKTRWICHVENDECAQTLFSMYPTSYECRRLRIRNKSFMLPLQDNFVKVHFCESGESYSCWWKRHKIIQGAFHGVKVTEGSVLSRGCTFTVLQLWQSRHKFKVKISQVRITMHVRKWAQHKVQLKWYENQPNTVGKERFSTESECWIYTFLFNKTYIDRFSKEAGKRGHSTIM